FTIHDLRLFDFDLLPARDAERARGGVAEDGEFEQAGAAPDGERLAPFALVGEETPEGANLTARDEEARAAPDLFFGEVFPRDVGDAVAEAVYVDDGGGERAFGAAPRPGEREAHEVFDLRPQLFGADAAGERARDGGEDVAPVERLAHARAEVTLVADVENSELPEALVDVAEDAVVRPDEEVSAALDDDGAAHGADA